MADPRVVKTYNGKVSGRSAGAYKIKVEGLDFGLGIIASADSEARSRRAFYPVVVTGSSFTMHLVWGSYEEREDFNAWFSKFMIAVSEGTAKHGALTIQVPSRKFIRTAVPEGSLTYGEGIKDVAYRASISFIGASDPINITIDPKKNGVSYFTGPKAGGVTKFFYPAGQQISGAGLVEGATFDTDPYETGYVPDAPTTGPIREPF